MKQEIKNRVMARSRQGKIEHFYSLCVPGETVLDAGITGERAPLSDGLMNYFMKTYRYAPETYTGLGICKVDTLKAAYPDKHFVRYDGDVFPFEDNRFDWVFSNAVIEHVGDESAQLHFLNEMLRVSRYVFFTTPNKFFPIETHTYVPFIHWNDRLFERWLLKFRPNFLRNNRLRLLSSGDIERLLEKSTARHHVLHRNRLLSWPMTLTVVASRLENIPEPRAVMMGGANEIAPQDVPAGTRGVWPAASASQERRAS